MPWSLYALQTKCLIKFVEWAIQAKANALLYEGSTFIEVNYS